MLLVCGTKELEKDAVGRNEKQVMKSLSDIKTTFEHAEMNLSVPGGMPGAQLAAAGGAKGV